MTTTRVRYVNTASTGGNGTTNDESGPNAAYSSLSASIAAEYNAGFDLTGSDEAIEIHCSVGTGTAADTKLTTISGFSTSATNYIQIINDNNHGGVWSDLCYRIAATSNDYIIDIRDGFVHVRGLQLSRTRTGAGSTTTALRYPSGFSVGDINYVDDCIFKGILTPPGDNLIGLSISSGGTKIIIRNCLFMNYDQTGCVAIGGSGATGLYIYAYNCTIVNCLIGIKTASAGATNIYAKNCGYYSAGLSNAKGFSGSFYHSSSDYNASNLANDAWGSHSRNSVTPLFISSSNYHLSPRDKAWKMGGTSLVADTYPVTDDIDGHLRDPNTPDIGFDEAEDPRSFFITRAGQILSSSWQSILGSPDAFTGTGNLDDYDAWIRVGGSYGDLIYDNEAFPAGTLTAMYYKDTTITSADYETKATAYIGDSNSVVRICCRIQAGTGYYYSAGIAASTGDLVISKVSDGGGVTLATQAASYSGTETLRLRTVTNGSSVNLTAQWGNNAELTVTDDGTSGGSIISAAGKPGVRLTKNGLAPTIDNFDVLQNVNITISNAMSVKPSTPGAQGSAKFVY